MDIYWLLIIIAVFCTIFSGLIDKSFSKISSKVKIIFWLILWIVSIVGFFITVMSGRITAYIASFLSVIFTTGWLIVEIRKAKKK